ncbi:nucleotidyltransferase substrate binding protein [Anoxynatronum sibiricum]|uniref:Nucleotidyltransferase substrate binding protein n=1 Tax=Anoxynatronum sibiricum TaxID=210623 RepID=A0ABU9VU83_9CLOT
MSQQDIRWVQRLHSFQKALKQLEEGVRLHQQRPLSHLEKQGLIQAFEFTHELAWKTLKDFLQARGTVDIFGSRDATREAYGLKLIENGQVWMEMIQSRNLSSHTYDEATADEIIRQITSAYAIQFQQLQDKMNILAIREKATTHESGSVKLDNEG